MSFNRKTYRTELEKSLKELILDNHNMDYLEKSKIVIFSHLLMPDVM